MKVIIVKPQEKPITIEINPDLKTMQEVVGGYIQAIFPFDDYIALIVNEEGKLLGLPLNRALRTETGDIYDIIAGTFFLCGAPPDSDRFTSLTPEQVDVYLAYFDMPEFFL